MDSTNTHFRSGAQPGNAFEFRFEFVGRREHELAAADKEDSGSENRQSQDYEHTQTEGLRHISSSLLV
jgi:hypothetical protein